VQAKNQGTEAHSDGQAMQEETSTPEERRFLKSSGSAKDPVTYRRLEEQETRMEA
jgi:hypothetical protein